jgi:uncharacterized glyoxalase superfamily protein PhnB
VLVTRAATAEKVLRARLEGAGLRIIAANEARACARRGCRTFSVIVEVDAADIDATEQAAKDGAA